MEFHGPLAVLAGHGGVRLSRELHGDTCAGRVPSSDGIELLLLKHHVIADDRRQFQAGAQARRKAQRNYENEAKSASKNRGSIRK